MASFPTTVVTWTNVTNNTDTVDQGHMNNAYAEIIAIETYLKNTLNALTYSATAGVNGLFHWGATVPSVSATTILNYNGIFKATQVVNPVYGDYAECYERGEDTEAGDIIALDITSEGDPKYIKAVGRANKYVRGVDSDTWGFLLGGEKPVDCEIPDSEYDFHTLFIPIGLAGKVYVKINGEAKKGQWVISSDIAGVGEATWDYIPGAVIGQIEENKYTAGIERVRMFITR